MEDLEAAFDAAIMNPNAARNSANPNAARSTARDKQNGNSAQGGGANHKANSDGSSANHRANSDGSSAAKDRANNSGSSSVGSGSHHTKLKPVSKSGKNSSSRLGCNFGK